MLRFLLISLIVAGCSSMKKSEDAKSEEMAPKKAVSDIHSSTMKNVAGIIILEDVNDHIQVTADVSGLKPNAKLGFHIHEKGVCEGDYKSAGDHFNPHHSKHGKPEGKMRHIGDLGNLETNANGSAKKVILLPKVEGENLSSLVGKSILIHAKADDFTSQPSGNSGDRIACGLIKPL